MTSPKNLFRAGGAALALVLSVPPTLHAQEVAIESEHGRQMLQLEAEGPLPPSEDGSSLGGKPETTAGGRTQRSASPNIDDDFIVFGYAFVYGSSGSYLEHYRWESLTHVGSSFITFDDTGNITNPGTWTGRDPMLRAGGAAENAGTKVIMVVLNDGFDVNVVNTVMASPSARATLVADIVDLLDNAGEYSHGVSFDFEPFSWNAAATTGMVSFFSELRTALDTAGMTNHEISLYADPTPVGTQWNLAGFTPNLDYYIYSCYDYATPSDDGLAGTSHAISDFNNYINNVNDFYLDGGVPANKMVLAISAYSRAWSGITGYNQSGTVDTSWGQGFSDALYETTIWPQFGGPQTENYLTGDEVSWHTWNASGTDYVRTWDSPTSLEYKIRHVLSNQDADGVNNGKRLRGVGFWALNWMAETSSINNNASDGTTGAVTRTRTYPHIYELCQEILKPKETQRFIITGFEVPGPNFLPRWRDPNASPDTAGDSDLDSARTYAAAPAGTGRPPSTTNAALVTADFESGSGNRAFFRHEILWDSRGPALPDYNAAAAVLEANMGINAYIHTSSAYSGRTIRMVVVDADGELEASDTYSLNATGWRQIFWNLADPTQINGYTTTEAAFTSGDGVLDSAGGGARDIGFVGFLIEGGGAGSVQVTIDEISYEFTQAPGREYKINEFRYNNASAEFIEIYGPAGNFPTGTELRFYDSADGTVLSSVSLAGLTVPVDGHFVVGDTSVTNVDLVPAGWGVADNIPNTNSGSIQIYNTATGCVYDSVVFRAYAGLGDLIRKETHGVTGESYAWLGETGSGTGDHVFARYPDGADTNVNQDDFSLMAATPGAANGGALTVPVSLNFTSAPAGAIATYQTFLTVASGVGASPSGGNVHRCVDTTGGGAQTYIGDPSLGGATGYTVTGEIFIPNGAAPIQSIGVGICGRQGSTFFTNTPNSASSSGYESGYWLIFENAAGAGLNDGRADHADTFEFVHATNDNMDDTKVSLLGSATRASTGASAGAWTTFQLTVDPVGNTLTAKVNGTNVYNGTIPAGGPTSGAFQVGFRENHAGAPTSVEGTWIDNLSFTPIPGGNDEALLNLD